MTSLKRWSSKSIYKSLLKVRGHLGYQFQDGSVWQVSSPLFKQKLPLASESGGKPWLCWRSVFSYFCFFHSIHPTSSLSWWHLWQVAVGCSETHHRALKQTSGPTFEYSKEMALLIPSCGDIIKARIKKIVGWAAGRPANQPASQPCWLIHACIISPASLTLYCIGPVGLSRCAEPDSSRIASILQCATRSFGPRNL